MKKNACRLRQASSDIQGNYLLTRASRISVRRTSSLVGSGGAAGASSSFFFALFIAFTIMNTDRAMKKKLTIQSMKIHMTMMKTK